jgi:hypothetical protein
MTQKDRHLINVLIVRCLPAQSYVEVTFWQKCFSNKAPQGELWNASAVPAGSFIPERAKFRKKNAEIFDKEGKKGYTECMDRAENSNIVDKVAKVSEYFGNRPQTGAST